jgi:hypothetical protein
LTPQGRFRAALSGQDLVAFAPLAWARLPEFLHITRTSAFWLEVGTVQRMLGDAASVCTADACVVPLLPRLRGPAGSGTPAEAGPVPAPAGQVPASAVTPRAADEIVTLPEVTAAVLLLRRLADLGQTGLVAELPPLASLATLIADPVPEDVEDALTDLVRAGVEAGAQAIIIRGTDRQEVARTVGAIAPLADFYGAKALGIDGERGWAADSCCPVGLLGRDGQWPKLARGVVLTAGDVTDWWTPRDMRAVLRERPGTS